MCSDLASRKGLGLKAGLSAMEMLLATRLPAKIEKLRSPRVTLRPRADESCDSRVGRNVLALTNNGMRRTATSKRTTIATRMLISGCFFTGTPQQNFPVERRMKQMFRCGPQRFRATYYHFTIAGPHKRSRGVVQPL